MPFDDEDARLEIGPEPLRPEPRGYAPGQMVRCEACLRANPPTRTSCLYCAAQLPATEANASLQKPTLRRLEKWEQGFNVILAPVVTAPADETLDAMAQLLKLDAESLRKIVASREPLPVALAPTIEEAALIERKLGELSVDVIVIGDHELGSKEKAVNRARALELEEDSLVVYPAGGRGASRVSWTEITLLVAGRLFMREIEVEERRSRSTENELLDARELSTDDAVLDIYTSEANDCFRIIAGNFDFSCLGPQKNLVASQNFSTLSGILRARAHTALYDDSYGRVRQALTNVWPLEHETESRGWRHRRPGQVSMQAVTRINNEPQFTRYSRLRKHLQHHHTELKA